MISSTEFATELERMIQALPEGFYDTFKYTRRGNNLTHPVTIGIITKMLVEVFPNSIVAHDIRFNEAGRKFQPDIVVLSRDLSPELYIDYESPNSSDSRVPVKDVEPYTFWVESYHDALPYYIITTLPRGKAPAWKLIHTGKNQYNAEFAGSIRKGTSARIRNGPFEFWFSYYRKRMGSGFPKSIRFFNIDRKAVDVVQL